MTQIRFFQATSLAVLSTLMAFASARADISKVNPPSETTLEVVRLSPSHTVTFTESDDGTFEVYERLHADHDKIQRRLSKLDKDPETLAEIHRYLLPGANVPRSLVEADTRAAQRQSEPDYNEQPPDDALASDGAHARPEASANAWDWNADATWFAQNFYTGGTDGYFAANATWVRVTKKRWTRWYKASAFNQSFDSYAHFRVDRSRSCGFLGMSLCWDTKLSEWVPNRQVITYIGEGKKYRKAWLNGSGPNPRVALAVRWTLAETNQPPPAPVSCGGHNQLICTSGARCKAGLIEYNGGCYGCGTVGQACCKDWSNIPTPGGWQGFCAQGFCGYPGGSCQ